jgi:two-component system vancomycin resistance associated response regulator VraR
MTQKKTKQDNKVRVMIVDDQAMSRQLFEMYVRSSPAYELVYSIESAAFADTYALSGQVDLILMDILMNDASNGLKAAEKIKKQSPGVKVICVTSMPEVSWIAQARAAGVDSFWYKESSGQTILEVMDRTMAGESVYPDSAPPVRIGLAGSDEFTDRELEVLRMMTTGASNQQIADQLYISENTVKMHIRHMLEKTGCQSRTELAIKARVAGIVIPLDEK